VYCAFVGKVLVVEDMLGLSYGYSMQKVWKFRGLGLLVVCLKSMK